MNVYTAKDLMGNLQNADSKKFLILSVFTHPACSGCGAAVEMGWELVQDLEGIQLKTVKLENREGQEMAQKCGIKTIPTMIIYRGEEECERMVGLPNKKDLEESLKRYLV
ncbi:MAG: thioredoxin domain-containing protein [SAR324 cluster bacterium]|nr:thioredoxin domain-containing protein [SAR324 cluster bacterium]